VTTLGVVAAVALGALVGHAPADDAPAPPMTRDPADINDAGGGLGPPVDIFQGTVDTVHPQAGSYMQFPFAASFPARNGGGRRVILLSFNRNPDTGQVPEQIETLRSTDGGRHFTALTTDVPVTSLARLADGSVLSVDTRATSPREPTPGPGHRPRQGPTECWMPPARDGTPARQFKTTFWRSTDDGGTWAEQHGTITVPSPMPPMRHLYFHRSIVTAHNGDLLATTYGCARGTRNYRVLLARSRDRGRTWQVVRTIASIPSRWKIEGPSEPTMARSRSGDLVMVMRLDALTGATACGGRWSGKPLLISRSTDDGRTWSRAQKLHVIGLNPYDVASADPVLVPMPNGELVLSFGRPYTHLLVSRDGSGLTWSGLRTTSRDVTSGYTSLVLAGPHEGLLFGDEGANWCFRRNTGLHPVAVWERTVDLPLTGV